MPKYNCYANRELSWLKFNQRVLEEAQDERVPLCERLSFLSIFQSNLDEFYMVRVGSLFEMPADEKENKTYMTSQEQLSAIFRESAKLLREKDIAYKNLCGQLMKHGVEIVDFHSISKSEADYLEQYYKSEVEPLLSPQIVSKKQPFPFLHNKAVYAVVVLEKKGSERLGIVPCTSGVLPELIPLPGDGHRFILSEELILHFMPEIFSHHTIKSKSLIRIIRSADIDTEENKIGEDEDYRKVMEKLIRKRSRLRPVRMEFSRLMDPAVIALLCEYLELDEAQVFHSEAPLKLSFLSKVRDMLRHDKSLFFQRRVPQKPADFVPGLPVIPQIEQKDRLLSFPYESIKPFLRLLREASQSPDVVSIKMTLYRVATNSKVVEALIEAAENGKEVVVLVELRARFDEENNIEWSRRLEDAGCRIIYGLDQMKVHSKLCLITRKKENAISYITQIGTGNYNEKTSEIYTDMSLMTANQDIGYEASQVFNALCLGQTVTESEHLLVAPNCLQNKLLAMMDEEIAKAQSGKTAYIGVKVNSLTDKKLIKKLIEASCAGVKIEMIIRGISCLIAGVPGETENITIRSIVGRFLEHHRIYIFGREEETRVYISSADFMTRNTIRRVEIAVPVEDGEIRQRILDLFSLMMQDNVKARIQQPDGSYKRAKAGKPALNAQEALYEEAYRSAPRETEKTNDDAVPETPRKLVIHPKMSEFLFYSYFGISCREAERLYNETPDALIAVCVQRAYLDMNRTLTFAKSSTNADKEGFRSKTGQKIAGGIGKLLGHPTDFDSVHDEICRTVMKYAKKYPEAAEQKLLEKFTYGQAQKWLNMALKYMCLMGFWDEMLDPVREKLHVPVDSFIIKAAKKLPDVKLPRKHKKEITPWSKWNDAEYKEFQETLRKAVKPQIPFDWEAAAWIETVQQNKKSKKKASAKTE